MLPKINRLTKKKDFEVVFKKGRSIKNGFLVCKILESQLPESRFGFVVSKKVSNKATVRNKVKRRLRDVVHARLKNTKAGIDVIIIALPGIEKKEYLQIQEMVDGVFHNLR